MKDIATKLKEYIEASRKKRESRTAEEFERLYIGDLEEYLKEYAEEKKKVYKNTNKDETKSTRAEVARFVENQLNYSYKNPRSKGGKVHYGLQDLRELLDFIYGATPKDVDEEINNEEVYNGRCKSCED